MAKATRTKTPLADFRMVAIPKKTHARILTEQPLTKIGPFVNEAITEKLDALKK